jgi:hypothetical protein
MTIELLWSATFGSIASVPQPARKGKKNQDYINILCAASPDKNYSANKSS